MKLPLRERKKIETRRRIIQSANALFKENGFSRTTLDQIADAVDIHKITVLRYFPSKEAIAMYFRDDVFEEFHHELSAHRGQVIDCWRGHIQRATSVATKLHALVESWEFINSEPALVAYQLQLDLRYQATLSRAFSEEAGVDPETDIYSRCVSALLVAGNSGVAHMALRNGSYDELGPSCLAVVEMAERLLRDRPTAEIA